MQETKEGWVRSLGQEDPLEKEGNDTPLPLYCLENSMDRGAWRAIVYGVAELDMTELSCTYASLVVQWLRCPSAGSLGSIPGQGARFCVP